MLIVGLVLLLAGCTSARAAGTTPTTALPTAPISKAPPISSTAPISTTSSASSSTRVVNVPVPRGEQAVDALGVEIFVPAEFTVDPPCPGDSVNRPADGLTYDIACGVPMPPKARMVWIAGADDVIDGSVPPRTTTHCLSRPVLDGEPGCVVQDRSQDPNTVFLAAIWINHDVGIQIQAATDQKSWAMGVFSSAHWVPVDRHGCAVKRSPVGMTGATSGDAVMLPEDTSSLSVCWYSQNRLVASAYSASTEAIRSLAHPTEVTNGPGITLVASTKPQADAPPCAELDRTEGIVFLAHAAGRADAISAAQLADCRGTQLWSNGHVSVAAGEPLASALRAFTGFLLVFGYRER